MLVLLRRVSEQPVRRSASPGLRATWHGNRRLLAEPHTRPLLVALCVPNGLIVGCEALFVPSAEDTAGLLCVAAALGMLSGDVLVGRVLTAEQRRRAATPLRVLLAAAFVPFALPLPLTVAVVLAAAGSAGYAASLLQQEQLVALAPADVRGRALGAEEAARRTAQGLGALIAGGIADIVGAGAAMTALAATSLVITVLLTPALGRAQRAAGQRRRLRQRGDYNGRIPQANAAALDTG